MVVELRSLIDAYLAEGRNRNLQTIATKAGMSYSAVRRIHQGEVKKVGLANVLSILKVVSPLTDNVAFLKEHFPAAGDYLEATNSAAKISENIDEDLERSLLDYDRFTIISLASMPKGTDTKQVVDCLGQHAAQKLEAMLNSGLLTVKNGRVHTAQEEFGTTDNLVISSEIGHSLRFIREENVGKQIQHLALHTKGLTREGQKLAHSLIQKTLIELAEIGSAHKGDIPTFFAAAMGIFTTEAVSQ